jgi:RNA polymerase sigma-70 factor (ECF subfamily)
VNSAGPAIPSTELFAQERPALLGVAYRMLASLTDAEDVVQEAWLRWSTTDQAKIANPAAWLTTVTTRLSLDRLRTVRRRREAYVGPWLPEPVATRAGPEEHAEMAESLSLAFLIVLDTLTPVERAVFLLADVFRMSFADVAETVGKTPEACRQIASRARRKVQGKVPPPVSATDHDLLERLLAATASGDVDRLMALMDADVVFVSDSGPHRHAARRPVRGADRVVRLVINLAPRFGPAPVSVMLVNNRPSIVIHHGDGPVVVQADHRGGRITVIRVMMNPDKLAGLSAVPLLV